MRVAIYARVSTDDKGQDPENQLHELRTWAINSGHPISGEYVDYAPFALLTCNRPWRRST
jgi:DNA invertase Pin-like site-specific DNA recombinase